MAKVAGARTCERSFDLTRRNAPSAASISSRCPAAGLLRAEEVSERVRRLLSACG